MRIPKAMDIINKNAQESGNPHAFYSGMVFGLGHSAQLLRMADREKAHAYLMALLEKIDDTHFKANQT